MLNCPLAECLDLPHDVVAPPTPIPELHQLMLHHDIVVLNKCIINKVRIFCLQDVVQSSLLMNIASSTLAAK